jgi:hypothetical protein
METSAHQLQLLALLGLQHLGQERGTHLPPPSVM